MLISKLGFSFKWHKYFDITNVLNNFEYSVIIDKIIYMDTRSINSKNKFINVIIFLEEIILKYITKLWPGIMYTVVIIKKK